MGRTVELTDTLNIYRRKTQVCLSCEVASLFFLFFFFLFRAAPMAYGSSQARGQIRVAAADLCHSHSHP